MNKEKVNKDYFIENDSKEIILSFNKALTTIKNQSKNIYRILKNGKTIGTGFLCNIPNSTYTNLIPVFITSNNILKYYDLINDEKIILQCNHEERKDLKINDGRKVYKSNKKGGNGILLIEIIENDGFDIDKFLEIDDILYKKHEGSYNSQEKNIYLIHYPNDQSNILKTFTSMNNISLDKYKIKYLKSVNQCSIGCPIINFSNFKIIGIYNMNNNEIHLNQENDLILSINEFIKDIPNKNEIIIYFESLSNKKHKKIYFLNDFKSLDNETNEILSDYYLRELSSLNVKFYIEYEDIREEEHSFKKYFKLNKEGNYKVRLVFNNKITDCSHMFMNCKYINRIDLSNFDMSNVTDMSYMFSGCLNLTTIKFSKLIILKK